MIYKLNELVLVAVSSSPCVCAAVSLLILCTTTVFIIVHARTRVQSKVQGASQTLLTIYQLAGQKSSSMQKLEPRKLCCSYFWDWISLE